MPTVSYSPDKEATFELKRSDDLIAVRTRSRRSLRSGPVLRRAAAEVADGEVILALPEAGVEVYRVPIDAGGGELQQRKDALRRDADVEFAGGVLVNETGEPVLYTENLFVKFVDRADPDDCKRVLQDAGLTIKRSLDYATNAFFAAVPEGAGQKVFDVAQALLKRTDVEYCHPELVQRRAARAIFPQQWHLQQTAVNGFTVKAHANVGAAHALTRGEGTTIAIIDDGIDVEHPEFAGASKIVAPRDATFPLTHPQARDPRPKDAPSIDNHGTACAGVACANGVEGASGVAPAARLMPIRLAAGLGSQQEADAFKWAADNGADVISCSWGPPDGDWWDAKDPLHQRRVFLPPSTKLAIDYAVTRGRDGKGCVVLFAAGNGNERVENDGYASYEKVIAVAACNDRGVRAVYSDFGAAVWCAFPSNDFGWPEVGRPEPLTSGIWTTDRLSALGYNPGVAAKGDKAGNYTNRFGGTSSACPGAAGIAALVLSRNDALKWNQVKSILKRACDVIDPSGGDYDADGHSALYGYGRLNAEKAVHLARDVTPPGIKIGKTFAKPIPDLGTIECVLDVVDTEIVQALSVTLDVRHTYVGDLVITLVPPAGRGLSEVILHDRAGGPRRDLKQTYDSSNTPGLSAYAGHSCNGAWRIRVADKAAEDSGTLEVFGLELTFMAAAPAFAPMQGLGALLSQPSASGGV